jgi:hypothetical protein
LVAVKLPSKSESNEQAIERLLDQLRGFAASVEWEGGFESIVNEMELRIQRLVSQNKSHSETTNLSTEAA